MDADVARSAESESARRAVRLPVLTYAMFSWSLIVPRDELQLFLSQYKQPIAGGCDKSENAS
jgi:hypothetical protein